MVQETQVQALGREDPLEEEWNPLQYLAGKVPWTEAPGSYSPWGRKEESTTEQLNTHTHKTIKTFRRETFQMTGNHSGHLP